MIFRPFALKASCFFTIATNPLLPTATLSDHLPFLTLLSALRDSSTQSLCDL